MKNHNYKEVSITHIDAYELKIAHKLGVKVLTGIGWYAALGNNVIGPFKYLKEAKIAAKELTNNA